MSSDASAPRSSYEEPYYNPQPQNHRQHQPPPNPGALILHPAQNQSQSYEVEPYLQPAPQQPPYSRHASHQSHRSYHSHHSHHSRGQDPDSDQYDKNRDLERRPTLGDTLSLMWDAFVGALSGKRR